MFRTGIGFDAHALAEGFTLVIGGVRIPHSKGCKGIQTRMYWYMQLWMLFWGP